MSISFILLYLITVFVASIIPGPSMMLALTHGMQYGARKTMASAMGNVTVTILQAFVSIAGLGTILIASETVFMIIKWAGAAYLIYIGISMLRSSGLSLSPDGAAPDISGRSLKSLFLQGSFVTAGNPKAIVFFTAVFPQFINPNAAYLLQSFLLLSILAVIAFICYMIYAFFGQKIFSQFSRPVISKYIAKVFGLTFIGTGIGLAVNNK